MPCSAQLSSLLLPPQPQFYNADQYAKRLVGNAYSIPVVDIILRRLQGMFASKRYEGYTYAFEWKDSGPEIHEDDDDDDEAQLFSSPTTVASMPSHPQPDQEEQQQQHDEENQKPSANVCVARKEMRPKREDDDQKPPAHDDGVNDEKESPSASQKYLPAVSGREISEECNFPDKPIIAEGCESEIPRPGVNDEKELPSVSQKNPPALSGREISEECSFPDKPIIAKVCESEIPRDTNTPPSCQVRDLSEEFEDI